jgi:uncharacterized protein YbjT (DUF2867 family)
MKQNEFTNFRDNLIVYNVPLLLSSFVRSLYVTILQGIFFCLVIIEYAFSFFLSFFVAYINTRCQNVSSILISMSSPSILIVGATGNTGVSAVKYLSQLISALPSSSNLPRRIIALTRNVNSAVSKQLAQLKHVEVKEKDWTYINHTWLIEEKVTRVYIAPHNLPHQFIDESKFLIESKAAKIQYLVKLSTNIHVIGPDSPTYYGRSHWAIENLLEQTEFNSLNWTVLRANAFMGFFVFPSIELLKKNKTNDPILFLIDKDAPVAMINPDDIGEAAAKLLALDDPSPHFRKKYNLSGPEDVTGKDLLTLLEEVTHQKIQPDYKSITFFRDLIKESGYPENTWESMEYTMKEIVWKGVSRLENTPTSPEILSLAPPHSTLKQFIQENFNN